MILKMDVSKKIIYNYMMNKKRIRQLNDHPMKDGTIIYWMQREHRVNDNWALLYAQELAKENKTDLAVIFCLRTKSIDFTERLITFMLDGLKEVEEDLRKKIYHFIFSSAVLLKKYLYI